MKRLPFVSACLFALTMSNTIIAQAKEEPARLKRIDADNKNIQYTGRIDFTDRKKPRFWSPGVYIRAKFKGSTCDIVVNDEILWGHSHNYLEIAIDDKKPFRIQTTGASNTIRVADGLSSGAHTITISKDTEAAIGYLEFVGFRCEGLQHLPTKPAHKLEFIGDSITCGAGSDLSGNPCGKGQWYDQHNAYESYGPTTARRLDAQWHLTSVSGIGLMHSCCDMKITMPEVFDHMNLSGNNGTWDFKTYQPDAVMICLGQNDGIQDPKVFTDTYLRFIATVRHAYPKAEIVCLTSPMADPTLTAAMKSNLTQIVERAHQQGDQKVRSFFFSRSYNSGCGSHPDLAQHQQIATELTAYLKATLHW